MKVKGGVETRATLEGGPRGDTLAVAFSQQDPAAAWSFAVAVRLTEGIFDLGTFTAPTPAAGASPRRVVAMACVPGALDWFVTVTGPSGSNGDVYLSSSQQGCGTFGLVALDANGRPV